MSRTLRWLLVLLLLANLAVAGAIYWKEPLEATGWLPEAPQQRVDLPRRPLPAIGSADVAEAASTPTPPVAQDSTADENARPEQSAAIAPSTAPSTDFAPSRQQSAAPLGDDAASSKLACIVLGPYANEALARAAMARIEAAAGQVHLQTEQIAAEPDYLVYVEPAVSKDVAMRTGQALQSQSIDAYVIPSGARQHGVSVGVFKVRELAQAQRQRVAELGYAVAMETLQRSATAYRIVARDVPVTALPQETASNQDGTAPYVVCEEADL